MSVVDGLGRLLIAACMMAPDAIPVPSSQPTAPVEDVPAEPPETIEQALARGESAYGAGDYVEAALAYEAAYALLDDGARAGKSGAFIGLYAAQSHRLAYDQSKDLAHLEAARDRLDDVTARRKAVGRSIPRSIGQERARVDAAMASHVPATIPTPTGGAPVDPLLECGDDHRLAYERLSSDDKASETGAGHVLVAAGCYCKANARDHDVALLDVARSLLGDFAAQRQERGLEMPREIQIQRERIELAIVESSTCKETSPSCSVDHPCKPWERCDRGVCRFQIHSLPPVEKVPPGTGMLTVGSVGSGFSIVSLGVAIGLRDHIGPVQWSLIGITGAASIALAVAGGVLRVRHHKQPKHDVARARVRQRPLAAVGIHP